MTTGRPVVTVDPAMRFGRPAVRGVSVEALAELVTSGEPVDAIADDYRLRRGDVLVACWHESRYGTRPHRRAWAEWLVGAEPSMAHGAWATIPDPPPGPER